MTGAGPMPHLGPVLGALAFLLVAGVAALVHLAAAARSNRTSWSRQLVQATADWPWGGRDLLALILLLAAAQFVRLFLGEWTGWDILAFQGVMIAGILWRLRSKARPFGAPLSFRSLAGQALVRWLAILPVLWFIAYVWQLLLRAIGHVPDFQMAIRMFLDAPNPWVRAGFICFAVVVAPVVEEILFRGILLPVLARRLGAAVGLALTAIGFAALHADVGSFAALAVFSVALSMAWARSGTLWVPILMHALFNGVNLVLLLALARAGVL